MRTRMLRWFGLVLCILAIAGCQHGQPAPTKIAPVPPAQPFVFYDETGNPSEGTPALSEVELREILDWVAAQTPDPVWLIRVKPSIGETRNHFVAYLTPNEATSRIRMGRAYDIPKTKEKTGIHSPWEYAQVSLPSHCFGAQFTKPPVAEMPFYWPVVVDPNAKKTSPMPTEDVIAIADAVRQPSSYNGLTGWDEMPRGRTVRAVLKSPIYRIEQKGNEIEVTLGFMHGLLWGHGLTVILQCAPTGYKVKEWGWWIS